VETEIVTALIALIYSVVAIVATAVVVVIKDTFFD